MMTAKIKIVQGEVAPRYTNGEVELELDHITITEKGMESGLPIVDMIFSGPDGEQYLFVTTGGIINTLSAAIRGINKRNHGVEEP